jgi:predicted alpha/beta superfamily hydrolase
VNAKSAGAARWPTERLMSLTRTEWPLRTLFFTVEPPRLMRADGFEWEHEIRVALPASYGFTDRVYPVLWITDNELECALAVLRDVELILVSIGAGRVSVRETSARRAFEFRPAEDPYFDGPGGEYLRRELPGRFPEFERSGGAGQFLDFLISDVRRVLAAEYRMDPRDHGLFGFSFGGAFVAYALFALPGAFSRYISGSPTLNTGDYAIFDAEERYAAEHDDLPADVFFGAGGAEMTEPVIAAWGCVSSMVRMVETLSLRGYPSLRLTAKLFPGESHRTVLPHVLSWGVRSVWGNQVASQHWSGEA